MNCFSALLYYIFVIIIWKNIIKRVIRFIYKTHEIQRIVNNPFSYNTYIKLSILFILYSALFEE